VQKNRKSKTTFANQIMMTFLLASVFVILGFFLVESCCFYGAKGDIMAPATIFLSVIVSVPFLALSMMGNTY
jgi:hypothetical protein